MNEETTGECLDEARAAGFVARSLDPEERGFVARHIEQCDDCRDWLVALVRAERGASENLHGGDGPPDAGDPLAGMTLGRYRLQDRIGRGAQAFVYRAYDPRLDRFVALKLLRDVDNQRWRARMLREARAMGKLSHPNVVPVFDAGDVDGELFITMELVSAGLMRDWLAAEHPGWRAIVDRFVDVGHGLAHVHGAGFVHRDVKPDNILVASDPPRALLADLGLTGTTANGDAGSGESDAADPSATATGATVGTPAYLAPEVMAGGPATPASDQLAFSRALWESLTGALPTGAPDPRPLRRAGVSERVARAICRGLAADPDARYPSMQAMVAELGDGRDRRTRRLILAAGAAAALAIAVGLTLWLANRSEPAAAACDSVVDRADALWAPRRDQLARHFAAVQPTGGAAAFATIDRHMTDRVRDWQAGRTAACAAVADPTDRSALLQAACLEDQYDALDDFAAAIGETTADSAMRVPVLAARLPRSSACSGDRPMAMPQPPREQAAAYRDLQRQLRTAVTRIRLGELDRASALLTAVAPAVRDLGNRALLAELRYIEASLSHRRDPRSSADGFRAAVELAERAGHDRTRTRALAALMTVPDLSYDEALEYGRRARAVLDRVSGSESLRADLEILEADLHRRHGQTEQSRAAALRARQALADGGDDDPSRSADVHRALAMTTSDPAEREQHAREALRLDRDARGDQTPQVLDSLVTLAEVLRWTGKAGEAVDRLREAAQLSRRVHGADHAATAQVDSNLCVALTDLIFTTSPTDPDRALLAEAETSCNSAIAIAAGNHDPAAPETGSQLAIYHSALGRLHNANRQFEQGAGEFARALELGDASGWGATDRATAQVGMASCLAELGRDLDVAVALLESARDTYAAAMGPEHAAAIDAFASRLRATVDAAK